MRVREHVFWLWTCYPAHSTLQVRGGTYTLGKGLCRALQQGWGSGGHLEPCLLSPIEHGHSLVWELPSSTWLSFGPFVLVSPAQGTQGLAPLTSLISLHISSMPSKLGKGAGWFGSTVLWSRCDTWQAAGHGMAALRPGSRKLRASYEPMR